MVHMSALKDRMRSDLTTSIKTQDHARSSTLRMLLTSITNAEVAGKTHVELSDDDIVGVLSTEAKKRREAATAFDDGGRTEMADKERAKSRSRLAILLTLMPGAKSSSKRVITGPGYTPTTLACTL